jgi:hypothetical protein
MERMFKRGERICRVRKFDQARLARNAIDADDDGTA